MLIEIDSYDHIAEGTASALNVSVSYLEEFLKNIYETEISQTEPYNWDRFESYSKEFIECHYRAPITEMYICHLSRMIEVPHVLLPLPQVLTTNNPMSSFFEKHNISFKLDGHKILLFYFGELKNPDIICDKASHLAYRLGYDEDGQDFCINGFIFSAGVENDMEGYFRALQNGPEILENLSEYLDIDLKKDYRNNSKFYKVYSKALMKNILFDGLENDLQTVEEKSFYFLKKCMEHLMLFYCTNNGMVDIPRVRLPDDFSVQVESFEEIQTE